MSDNIKKFDEYLNEGINNNFNYNEIYNFCAVRNIAQAGYGGDEISPRLQFITSLLDRLGIEYELDTWTIEHALRTELEDFFGFSDMDVDDFVEVHVRAPEFAKQQEKTLLHNAFRWFNLDIDEIKTMLRQAERDVYDKRKRKILNDLIKFKNQIKKDQETTKTYFNIYIKGSSDKMIMAHHDVMNVKSDNCNDNSASVINAIACKTLMPEINVAITDGEETGGIGAQRASEKINEGFFGNIEFVLNFELTALGGTDFFIENYPRSPLFQRIENIFPNVETFNVPFHDGIILRHNGIDSVVINPLPRKENGQLDYSLLRLCHSTKDDVSVVDTNDMKDFCEQVVVPIIRNERPGA
jgi:hypothetical protein